MDVSLVIPCFNEAERIGPCLDAASLWLDRLAAQGGSGEAVVVDDGSTDRTAEIAGGYEARRGDVRVVRLPKNAGKGEAIRHGVLASRGDVIVFFDADLAVDVSHVDSVLPHLKNGVDVAVGCRHVEGASVEKPQGALRRTLGRGYLGLTRWWLDLGVSDVTCGFKGFKREVALDLFGSARCRRWGFDAEILFLAERAGYVLKEVPVTWRDGSGSRVRMPGDLVRSLAELVAVRWRSATGRYPRPGPRDAT